MPKITVQTKFNGEKQMYSDEIAVEMVTGLGCDLGCMLMPKKIEKGLIEAYKKPDIYDCYYLYINGEMVR